MGLEKWFTFNLRAEYYVCTAAQVCLLCSLCFWRLRLQATAVEAALEDEEVSAPPEYNQNTCSTCFGRFYRNFGHRAAHWLWLPLAFAATMASLSWFNMLQLALLSLVAPFPYHTAAYRRLSVATLFFISLVVALQLIFAVPSLINFNSNLLSVGLFLPPSDTANYVGSVQSGSYLLLSMCLLALLMVDISRVKMMAHLHGTRRYTSLQLFDAASTGDVSVLKLAASDLTKGSLQAQFLGLVGLRGSLFHVAVEYGQLDAVKLLLELRLQADVDEPSAPPQHALDLMARDFLGNTALHNARLHGQLQIQDILVSAARTRGILPQFYKAENSARIAWNQIEPLTFSKLRIRVFRFIFFIFF